MNQIFSSIIDLDIVTLLQTGKIGVIPTDTVYGVVAQAANQEAVRKLYASKHREGKPGTVVAANMSQLVSLGLERHDLEKVAHFWPGAISVIVPASEKLLYLHEGLYSLAVRVPALSKLNKLLLQTGPLITSSANMPGEPPATTLEKAKAYFGDTVDFYVDGGYMSPDNSSTLIRINTEGDIEVLRQGVVKIT